MKANAKELFEVIRQVVRDEMKKALPEMVKRHLTEAYIQKMISETVAPPPSKSVKLAELLAPQVDVDEDQVPEPQLNTDHGIYNSNRLLKPELKKESANPKVGELKKKLGSLAFVLEGVKLPEDEKNDPGIPLPVEEMQDDFARMGAVLEATNSRAANQREMPTSMEAKMRELEMKRKALEVPVKGANQK